jgi:hypothetical protein
MVPLHLKQSRKANSHSQDEGININKIKPPPMLKKILKSYKLKKQEGFLRCQTPTSALRLEVEGCRFKNGGWRIEN